MWSIEYRKKHYRFRPSWLGLVITLICIPVFIKLGLWQYYKAQAKLEIQKSYQNIDSAVNAWPVLASTSGKEALEKWRYKSVKITGVYEAKYQLLLDNQVYASQAGYHVITPFKIAGTEEYVLINRGWIAGGRTRDEVPEIKTPVKTLEVTGKIWIPSQKFFTLEDPAERNAGQFQQVWQHLDLEKYKRLVPIKVSPLMIKLDELSDAGGFVRDWEIPQQRIVTHLGYAYQWFGFAIAALLIFVAMSFVHVKDQ